MDIIFYILLNLLSISIGVTEGILYSKKASEAFKWNEHIVFVINRAICAGCILISPYTSNVVQILIACVFIFPLLHDGAYYVTRSKIDVPEYRFNSDSTTSSATFEIKFKYRVGLFLIGIAILFIDYEAIKIFLKYL